MKKGLICLTIVCLLVLSLVLTFALMNGSTRVCYGLNDIPSSLEGGSDGLYGNPLYGRAGQGLYDISD